MTAEFLGASGKALTYMFDRPWEEAKARLEQCLEMTETAFGPAHLKTANAVSDLAWGLIERSNQPLPAALKLFERALSIYERDFGADHPDTARAQCCVGMALDRSGESQQGRALLEKGYAVLKLRLGSLHIATVHAECELGRSMVFGPVSFLDLTTAYKLSDDERYRDHGWALVLHGYSVLEAELGPDHPQLRRTRKFFKRISDNFGTMLHCFHGNACVLCLCCAPCTPCYITVALRQPMRHFYLRLRRLRSAIGGGVYRPSIAEKYFPLPDPGSATVANKPVQYDAHLLSPFSQRLALELRPRTREETTDYLTTVLFKCDANLGPFSPESATTLFHLGAHLFTLALSCKKPAQAPAAAAAAIVPALKRCLDIKVRVLNLWDVECADAHFFMGQLYFARHGLVQSVNFNLHLPDGAGLKCLSDECQSRPDQCIAPASRVNAYCADMALRHFESAYNLRLKLLGRDHEATRKAYILYEYLHAARCLTATCAAPCWLACCDPWSLWHKCCCGYRYRDDGGPGA